MTNESKQQTRRQKEQDHLISNARYRSMWIGAVLSVSTLAIAPLIIMAGINYSQFQDRVRVDVTRPMIDFTTQGKQALELFFAERVTALQVLARQTTFERLVQPGRLDTLLLQLQNSFDGFVDLGAIGAEGRQLAYAGPPDAVPQDFANSKWFRELGNRSSIVSEAISSRRNLPIIVIAIRPDLDQDNAYTLWVTLRADAIHWLFHPDSTGFRNEQCAGCHSLALSVEHDLFLINRTGLLQTPSLVYGDALVQTPLPLLSPGGASTGGAVSITEFKDVSGESLVISYASIDRTPFTLVYLGPHRTLQLGWLSLQRDLALALVLSIVLILGVVTVGSTYVVNRVREADKKRAALFHKMEYTNKLAAIGRLGAGVAHEINNPLAIIGEKAGLLKDLLVLKEELPSREKLIGLVDSVLKSAERCGGITRNLLGFAKQMEVKEENINLGDLLHEVLAFLEREASYRDLRVGFTDDAPAPSIVSDRGQLQQVFLNIINNAFAAVSDGGSIDIGIKDTDGGNVSVSITDNGAGIEHSHLEQIFDPFFTTKKGGGTGLGLSITYGIVQKLGGQIDVESEVGVGTCFTVSLPKTQASD